MMMMFLLVILLMKMIMMTILLLELMMMTLIFVFLFCLAWLMLVVRAPVSRDVHLRFHGYNKLTSQQVNTTGNEPLVKFPKKLFKDEGDVILYT